MTTQVLIVHGQLPFAIKLKQTLERGAPFEAHPFTSVEAAVDYLTDHVQDVAVVDFAVGDIPGDVILEKLRTVQPQLVVIATPKLDADRMRELDIIGSLDAGFNAHDLISIINNFYKQRERPSVDLPGTTALLSRITRTRRTSEPTETDNAPEYSSIDDMIAVSGTNIFQKPAETDDAPEDYSSLDDLLAVAGTNLFEQPEQPADDFELPADFDFPGDEPPVVEDDTPSGPPEELAWADEQPSKWEPSFEDILNSLPADTPESAAPNSPFNDLVNSMRTEEVHRPLPSRQQQLVEFILSGGADSLENEPSKAAAEPSPEPEAPAKSALLSAFDRLAKDEPAPPTFEESGTVSDLVEGVQDRSFRNVLSILSGEEVGDEGGDSDSIAPASPADFDVGSRRDSGPSRPVEIYAFDDVEPTPAKMILQRTLEQTLSGGTFSLEDLLSNIDAQLPLHRPKVQPLPSWVRDQQKTTDDPFMVREPEFLPEEMPDEPTPIEASEDLFNDQTTIASRGQQIEAHPESLETEWLESREPTFADPFDFPDTLPEEFPADATVVHQSPSPMDETIVNRGLAADDAFWDNFLDEAVREEQTAQTDEGAADEAELWDVLSDDLPQLDGESLSDETPLPAVGEVMWDEGGVTDQTPVHSELAAEDTAGLWYDLPEQDFNTQFEMMAAFEVHGETGMASGALYAEMPAEPEAASDEALPSAPTTMPESASSEEEYLAQLALSLTEASLELTAEATLLARDKQIVAYAGRMPAEEIEELRGTIADDWDAAPGEARIRFITAPGSGKDYMLFSRRTEDDFTLSLIFAGTTPLRDIRRQGKRLVDALLSVPEAPAQPKAPAPPVPAPVETSEVTIRTPYACVWLLSDPHAHLDSGVSQALTAGLNVQMHEQGWTIQTLQVHEDYVYLLADVPGETPAYQIIRDLKRRSAEIAHAQNPTYTDNGLWADGYLVVMPGRELDTEEIQQFINFERME